jgi:transposase
VFMDESGFRLLPSVVATFAPRGHTPILAVPLSWEHLSVMGTITAQGHLFSWMLDHAVKAKDLVRFLKHLLTRLKGKILLVWDGLPAHRSQLVKDFLSQGAAKRLQLLQLPAYAPELNPQEGIWNYLKNVELKNLCCHDLDELRLELRRAIERLRPRVDIIQACVRQPGCYV